MEIKRKVLLSLLEQVMPVISSKSAKEHQNLHFYKNRLQATNGRVWVDTKTDFSLNIQVQAEPLFLLVKKLRAKDLNLEVKDDMLYVSTKKAEGEFSTQPTAPAEIPQMDGRIPVEDVEDFVFGLQFCRLGVSIDDAAGPLCGIAIKDNKVWGCDKYRILCWTLDKATGINCCAPAKLADILHKYKDEITSVDFVPGETEGTGCFGVTLGEDTTIWAGGIEGEYRDLSSFFPEGEAEVLELDEDFLHILERHLANQKDVSKEDKEMTFIVNETDVLTISQKYVGATGQVERKLEESVDLKEARAGKSAIEFGVNPQLLKDVVGLSLKFKYYKEENVVLFETDKFQYVIMARG